MALVAACGGGGGASDDTSGDDQPPGDAKHLDAAIDITEYSGDFACNNVAWPATAPDPLSVIARVKDPVNGANVGGAAVEIHKPSDDALLVMGTAATNGIFALNVATAGVAPAIYRKATLAGRLDGYTYDPYPPFDTNHPNRDIYAPTAANRDTYYAAAGIASDPAKSTVLVEIFDCLDLQVYGATIEAPVPRRSSTSTTAACRAAPSSRPARSGSRSRSTSRWAPPTSPSTRDRSSIARCP